MSSDSIQIYLKKIHQPQSHSHKGQNGKTLLIGGSNLFHAASRWSFLAASRIVDMTFYASISENNEMLRDAKMYAQDGVVISRQDIPEYISEADSILIGPGMRRDSKSRFTEVEIENLTVSDLNISDWEIDTFAITRILLLLGENKKWVIDAGALQVIDPKWVTKSIAKSMVLTPHTYEMQRFAQKVSPYWKDFFVSLHESIQGSSMENDQFHITVKNTPPTVFTFQSALSDQADLNDSIAQPKFLPNVFFDKKMRNKLHEFSEICHGITFVLKGATDIIWNAEQIVAVSGGNAALTKGGTGDVFAGSLVGFLATSDPFASSVVASYLNKLAGYQLFLSTNTMYNSSDLVDQLPIAWADMIAKLSKK